MTARSMADALEAAFHEAAKLDAPLAARLKYVADAVSALSPEFQTAVDEFVARLHRAGAGEGAPAIGTPMPPFALPDERGRVRRLEAFLAEGPQAVVFHRGHWCPYCRLSLAAMAEVGRAAKEVGAGLIAITPEPQPLTKAMRAAAGFEFPVLTDLDNGYALSLGLAIWVEEGMAQMIKAAGWDIGAYQGSGSWMLPIPAGFVLDRGGVVRARFVDPDYRLRMPMEDILRALKDSVAKAAVA